MRPESIGRGRYVDSTAALRSYTTTFPLTETLSEGGIWLTGQRDGRDWTNVVTAGGIAYGTQSGSSPTFDDSVACLSAAFPANQYCEVTVHIGGGLSATSEISLLLRATISTGVCLCYGTNYAYDGSYSHFGRWPGFITSNGADYVTLASNLTNPVGALQDGDIFQAQITGYTFTTWHVRGATRTLINTGTDTDAAKIASGKPGFGTWNNGHAATNAIGATRFYAVEI